MVDRKALAMGILLALVATSAYSKTGRYFFGPGSPQVGGLDVVDPDACVLPFDLPCNLPVQP